MNNVRTKFISLASKHGHVGVGNSLRAVYFYKWKNPKEKREETKDYKKSKKDDIKPQAHAFSIRQSQPQNFGGNVENFQYFQYPQIASNGFSVPNFSAYNPSPFMANFQNTNFPSNQMMMPDFASSQRAFMNLAYKENPNSII